MYLPTGCCMRSIRMAPARQELLDYQRKYLSFAIVDEWHLSKYLEVLGSFTLLNHIKGDASQQWGDMKFKCSCKACHVRGCCRENLLWSMVLNHKLVIPPKWSRHQPGERKRKGCPTEKRLAKLKECGGCASIRREAKPRVICS